MRPLWFRHRRARLRSRSRRAAAAVEAAVAMPLLVLLVFGSIELADGIFLKQTLSVAAYEGARAVSRQGGTSAEGQSRVAEVLAARGISDYALAISPEATPQTPGATEMRVHVSAPSTSISWSPLRLFSGKTVEKTVVMARQ